MPGTPLRHDGGTTAGARDPRSHAPYSLLLRFAPEKHVRQYSLKHHTQLRARSGIGGGGVGVRCDRQQALDGGLPSLRLYFSKKDKPDKRGTARTRFVSAWW
jgi:hypothetical protein